MNSNLLPFFSGFAMATFAASGLFFLKLWRVSKDRFYLLFCVASWLIALERVLLFTMKSNSQDHIAQTEGASWVYLIRLSAFLVIVAAIVHKNRNPLK